MIVVPDDFPSVFEGSAAHDRAQALGTVRVHTGRGADAEDELARRIGSAKIAINIRAHARFSDAVLQACPELRMISTRGTGTDNIDLAAAARRGVVVCNTAGVNAIAVAEHAIALMLAVARKIPAVDREMRSGAWPRETLVQLHGKTLGVFGAGAIGAHVARLGRAFGMMVLAWSARGDTARLEAMGLTPASKQDILRRADFISLHLRLTPATRGFIGRGEFAATQPGAILVNTGRGQLIDREALIETLAAGRIAGAGLDVFHDEPIRPDDPLLDLATTVLSPHHAGQTAEVRRDGLLRTIENIANFLNGSPTNVVSSPS
ncbi:MAG: NAD(P)-dependent oxidoreductase [Pseudomonadota bacterium]